MGKTKQTTGAGNKSQMMGGSTCFKSHQWYQLGTLRRSFTDPSKTQTIIQKEEFECFPVLSLLILSFIDNILTRKKQLWVIANVVLKRSLCHNFSFNY